MDNDESINELIDKVEDLIDEGKENNGTLTNLEVAIAKLETQVQQMKGDYEGIEKKLDRLIERTNDPNVQNAALRQHINDCPALQFYERKKDMLENPSQYTGVFQNWIWKFCRYIYYISKNSFFFRME